MYRAHRWNEDRSRNQEWIAKYSRLISAHAASVRTAIAKTFHVSAPSLPILVDVVVDVGPTDAYTTEGPRGTAAHTRVAPQRASDADLALDTLGHEISHAMDDQIPPLIDAEVARQNRKAPPDLWHAMTLYTTNDIVRREVGKTRDDPSYAPNARIGEIFARGGWQEIQVILQEFWQPYLDGHASFSEALSQVVRHAGRN